MKNYLYDVFNDQLLSYLTKKYGTKLNDSQREDKAYQIISDLKAANKFTVEGTQSIIDRKGLTSSSNENINGQPVYALVKEGMFKKIKVCYFITRIKELPDAAYLEKIYDELRRQANGENVFGAKEYKNG